MASTFVFIQNLDDFNRRSLRSPVKYGHNKEPLDHSFPGSEI